MTRFLCLDSVVVAGGAVCQWADSSVATGALRRKRDNTSSWTWEGWHFGGGEHSEDASPLMSPFPRRAQR